MEQELAAIRERLDEIEQRLVNIQQDLREARRALSDQHYKTWQPWEPGTRHKKQRGPEIILPIVKRGGMQTTSFPGNSTNPYPENT